jgi:hypothetical protein
VGERRFPPTAETGVALPQRVAGVGIEKAETVRAEPVEEPPVGDSGCLEGRVQRAIELLQAAASGLDELGQLCVGGFDLLVDGGEFGDQLRGELAAGASDDVTGRTVLSSAGLRGGQELLRPAGHQFQQQVMQSADGLGTGLAQAVTAVDQQPQCDRGVIDNDLA